MPGFEAELSGMKPDDSTEFDLAFPDDYRRGAAPRQDRPLRGDAQGAAREDPAEPDDDFAGRFGDFDDARRAQGRRSRSRLERNALDQARHEFADRIIEYAIANATLDLPDILVDQEVEVMHDEFRGDARPSGHRRGAVPQGDRARPRPTCMPSSGRAPSSGQGPARPDADRRGRGRDVPEADIDAEVQRARERYQRPQDCPPTSSPTAAATSSAARCAAPPRRGAGRRVARRPPGASAAPAPRGPEAAATATPKPRPPPRSAPPIPGPSRISSEPATSDPEAADHRVRGTADQRRAGPSDPP